MEENQDIRFQCEPIITINQLSIILAVIAVGWVVLGVVLP